jgi:hypothetical protein
MGGDAAHADRGARQIGVTLGGSGGRGAISLKLDDRTECGAIGVTCAGAIGVTCAGALGLIRALYA